MTMNMNTKTITYLELMQKIADNDQPAYVRLNDSLYKWDGQDYMCGDKRLYSALMHRSMAAMRFVKIEYIDDLLTKSEKRYLEAVLKPFKARNPAVIKRAISCKAETIEVIIDPLPNLNVPSFGYPFIFPLFEFGAMYKSLEVNNVYSVQQLGLWQEEESEQ